MPTTAIIAAGVGAAGSIGAAAIGANAQTSAAKSAAQTENSMYDTGLNFATTQLNNAKDFLNPYITAGSNALTNFTNALPSLTKPFSAATLPTTPGYQFDLNQGLKGVQNSYAAQGLGSSGAAEKGAASFATGTAQNTYNQQFQNYLQQNSQDANLLYQPVTTGANASNSLANLYSALGGAGLGGAITTGQGVASTQIGAGNAIAGAATGAANGLTSGANTALQYGLLSQYLGNNAYNANISPYVGGVQNNYGLDDFFNSGGGAAYGIPGGAG